MNGLPCMNCHKEVGEGESKIFAEVFLCEGCAEMATRLFSRFEGELKKLLFMSKETIRQALVRGELRYAEGEEPPKRELFKMIVELSEAADDHRQAGG